jgi:hypothetical protein
VRLRYVLAPTALDPGVIERTLSAWKSTKSPLLRLETAVTRVPEAEWETALVSALRSPEGIRTGLVNEQLTELDHRLQRWVRVPRVCASICTSSGFLLAAAVLRVALGGSEPVSGGEAVDAAVFQAINVASVGLAGAAFCIAIQMRARRAAASKAEAFDRMVLRLERETEAPRHADTPGGSAHVRTA